MDSVRLVHGRDTCDEAGRPLSTYTCGYHEGFEDGVEAVLALPVEQRMQVMGMTKRTMHATYEAHHLCNDGCTEVWGNA